jgi:phage-related protein
MNAQTIKRLKRLEAWFYSTPAGREPVREWLRSLPVVDRKIVGTDIKAVEFGWPLGKPLVGSIGRGGLWEVRSSLTSGRIARVLFTIEGARMVLLHGFIKKTRRTPPTDISLAVARMKGDRP